MINQFTTESKEAAGRLTEAFLYFTTLAIKAETMNPQQFLEYLASLEPIPEWYEHTLKMAEKLVKIINLLHRIADIPRDTKWLLKLERKG